MKELRIVYTKTQIISTQDPRREQSAGRTELVNRFILMDIERVRGRGPVKGSIRVRHWERTSRVVQRVRQRRVERVPA